eukprot:10478959-Lingulodinium_polyedra.AAC.1
MQLALTARPGGRSSRLGSSASRGLCRSRRHVRPLALPATTLFISCWLGSCTLWRACKLPV